MVIQMKSKLEEDVCKFIQEELSCRKVIEIFI
jgi:hypothetical protein